MSFAMDEQILTRFLVLSDTHDKQLDRVPEDPVDVLIHCGDLTELSMLGELERTIDHLRTFRAPLKLVIAGNHDFTLDTPAFRKIISRHRRVDYAYIKQAFGDFGQPKKLFDMEDVKKDGIVFLDEEVHEFRLANGALLKLFASPYTPSLGGWGFGYHPNKGRKWSVPEDVEVVITHGPPLGVLDRTFEGELVGDLDLFTAVACARPQLHCFGHIHESWGATMVTWRKEMSDKPSHSVGNETNDSQVIENLTSIRVTADDSPEVSKKKELKMAEYKEQGYCSAGKPPNKDAQTLFINASIEPQAGEKQHVPWKVDLKLPRAG